MKKSEKELAFYAISEIAKEYHILPHGSVKMKQAKEIKLKSVSEILTESLNKMKSLE